MALTLLCYGCANTACTTTTRKCRAFHAWKTNRAEFRSSLLLVWPSPVKKLVLCWRTEHMLCEELYYLEQFSQVLRLTFWNCHILEGKQGWAPPCFAFLCLYTEHCLQIKSVPMLPTGHSPLCTLQDTSYIQKLSWFMKLSIIIEVLISIWTRLIWIKRYNSLGLLSLKRRPGGDLIAMFKYVNCSCREKMNYLFIQIEWNPKVLWNKEDDYKN